MANALLGFETIFHLNILIYIAAGTLLGIVFGALPGLTATMAVALIIPITFELSPIQGMAMLMGAYCGGISGGSISATLLKIPGTPAAICTTFDAYPMSRKGKAGLALSTAIISSFIGGILSFILLMILAPILSELALKFGPTEYFALAILGLTVIASISAGSILKGLISGLIGVLFSFVGTDPLTGMSRFTFGIPYLLGGIKLLPALIGLFGVSQVFLDAEIVKSEVKHLDKKGLKLEVLKIGQFIKKWRIIMSSAIIGTFVGILPGAGCSIASFLSYKQAKTISKTPDDFGKGCIDGIIASETSNNAVTGGATIPLLTLGIPGDATTAVMIGGLMLHGLRPGPLLFIETPNIAYGIIMSLLFANIFMLIFQFFGIQIFANVLKVPRYLLLPVILVLCAVGSYGIGATLFDIKITLLFGIIGYIFLKLNYGVAPMVLGLILGKIAEPNARMAYKLYNGNLAIFVDRPVTLILLILSLALLLLPSISIIHRSRGNP